MTETLRNTNDDGARVSNTNTFYQNEEQFIQANLSHNDTRTVYWQKSIRKVTQTQTKRQSLDPVYP
jgi:hypothetical protein